MLLSNKKVLLFVPGGCGIYGTEIKKSIESCGASVHVYNERPFSSTAGKIFTRLTKKISDIPFNAYLESVVRERVGVDYDYVLIIRAEAFKVSGVKILRHAFPRAMMMLYLWDSFANTDVRDIVDSFDVAFSYDPMDVSDHRGLRYCPTFYLDQYRDVSDVDIPEIDLFFAGTVHSDRYEVIDRVKKRLEVIGRKFDAYYYFPSRLLYIKKYIEQPLIRSEGYRNIHFKMIGVTEMARLVERSRVVLDIQHPRQSGLTLRPVEVLGARRKLITTNKNIASYDFYDPNNIMIIDRECPYIDPGFFESRYCDVKRTVYEQYSIKSWVSKLFSLS
mgnify:CR=1 FL=1|jgi:hypothetical protein